MQHNWKNYFKAHAERKPRAILVEALSFCVNKKAALDLGSGTFIEAKFLLEEGFEKVTAIDNAAEAKTLFETMPRGNIDFKYIPFKEYDFPENAFDLINAQFALPFFGKEGFDKFMIEIKKSLKEDGVFVGQFFGNKDGWNTQEYDDMIFHTKSQALEALSGTKIIKFEEVEKDDGTASGAQKHWHVFHFITQKTNTP